MIFSVIAGLLMVFKHSFSFATNLAANFGCNFSRTGNHALVRIDSESWDFFKSFEQSNLKWLCWLIATWPDAPFQDRFLI